MRPCAKARLCLLIGLLVGPALVLHAAEAIDDAETECHEHMQVLANGLLRFMALNEGKLPTTISKLYQDGFVGDLRQFTCPASKKQISSAEQIDTQTDYELIRDYPDERPIRLVRELHGYHHGQALAFYSDRSFRKVAAAVPPSTNTNVAINVPPDRGTIASNVIPAFVIPTNEPPVVVTPADLNPSAPAIPLISVTRAPVLGLATKPKPDEPLRLHRLGKEQYGKGRWAEAETALRQAARLERTNASHHFNLGAVLAQQAKWGEAEAAYREAVRLLPGFAQFHAERAGALLRLNRPDEARQSAQEAIRLGYTAHWSYAELGLNP